MFWNWTDSTEINFGANKQQKYKWKIKVLRAQTSGNKKSNLNMKIHYFSPIKGAIILQEILNDNFQRYHIEV